VTLAPIVVGFIASASKSPLKNCDKKRVDDLTDMIQVVA